jgi:hypothetical protein
MIDKTTEINAKFNNKEQISKMTVNLINYYSDPQKQARKAQGLCKCCFYVNTSRWGGTAITFRNCAECGKEMSFGNTCTDILCNECAVSTNHCKYCGQKLD